MQSLLQHKRQQRQRKPVMWWGRMRWLQQHQGCHAWWLEAALRLEEATEAEASRPAAGPEPAAASQSESSQSQSQPEPDTARAEASRPLAAEEEL